MNKNIYSTLWLLLATVLVMSSSASAQCCSRGENNLSVLEDSFTRAASEMAENGETPSSDTQIAAGPATDDHCTPGATRAKQAYYGAGLPTNDNEHAVTR